MDELPPDTDLIILQHHERPDGSGFPRGLTHTRIGTLASLFILAEDLVHHSARNGGRCDLHVFKEEYGPTYGAGHFKRVFKSLPS